MKKILTLLVMFLATASILTAQTPQLNYQMIVRDKSNNDLVVNTPVTGQVQVLTANATNNAAVYVKDFTSTTNMNGMLTILLDYQNGYTKLDEIDWTQAWFKVSIPAYGIDTIMEILPVPYAYKTFTKDNITTPRIVKYINNSKVSAVEAIDAAITGNTEFITALRDSVADVLKRHPGKVKELAIYFIGTVVPQDVENAAKAIKKDVAEFVKDTVADYIKSHREEAYNIVRYFIGETTVEDVTGLWNAAMKNANVDEIVEMVVDSVNKYIERHPELAVKTAKYIVTHLTAEDVFALQNFTKTNNKQAYDTAKGILNSLIDQYMEENKYQKVQCDITELCDLMNEIEQFNLYGTVVCPTLGETSVSSQQFQTPISYLNQVQIENVWYEVSFPNSNYPSTTIDAQLAEGESIMKNAEIIPQEWAGRIFIVTPKMKAKCMDTETSGDATEYNCSNGTFCECPNIASFTHTSDAAADLINYHGIRLQATITNNYHNNSVSTCGFEYKEGNGEWKELHNTNSPAVLSNDKLTVTDTIKMNFCGKTILVRPYVKCGETKYYGQYVNGETVTLRQFELFISPESPVTGATEFTVTNGIYIGSDEFGTHWPSVETIVAKYGSIYGVNVEPEYKWQGTNTNYSQNGKTVTISTSDTYKVTCTIPALFNSSENCVLEKEFSITVH